MTEKLQYKGVEIEFIDFDKPNDKVCFANVDKIQNELTGESTKITIQYGHSVLKQVYRIEGNKLACYGYRIDYDLNGKETGRSEPTFLSSIGYD